jgi:hypothetical protein
MAKLPGGGEVRDYKIYKLRGKRNFCPRKSRAVFDPGARRIGYAGDPLLAFSVSA